MKLMLLLSIGVLCVACSNEPKKPVDVRPRLASAILQYASAKMGEGVSVDTVILLDVDTLTAKSKISFQINMLSSKFSQLQANADLLKTEYKLKTQKALLNKDLFGRDNALTTLAVDDANEAKAKAEANLTEMSMLVEQIDSLNKLVQEGRFDSTMFLGYHPKFLLKIFDVKSGSVKDSDTLFVMIDKDFRVIETQ